MILRQSYWLIRIICLVVLFSCNDNSVSPPVDNDYFPMEIGNWWVFKYDYKPIEWDFERWEGEVKWEIIEKAITENGDVYRVKETVNGLIIFPSYPNYDLDTTVVADSINFFNLIQDAGRYIEITPGNYFGRHIKINRFYSDLSETLIFNNNYFPVDDYTDKENLISLDDEGHRIILQKDVGMIEWKIDNTHNSGPDGDLYLLEYNINETYGKLDK